MRVTLRLLLVKNIEEFGLVHPARVVIGAGHHAVTVRALLISRVKPPPAGGANVFIRAQEVGPLDPVGGILSAEHGQDSSKIDNKNIMQPRAARQEKGEKSAECQIYAKRIYNFVL